MHELRTEPRQRRSQRSIDAILDAAERLIHDRGQVSFTANELAVAADMSIGRVYYWFPDIPSVVSALAERSANRMLGMFADLLDSERTVTSPLLVERAVQCLCDFLDQNPATTALVLTGMGEDGYGRELHERMCELVRPIVAVRVQDVPEAEADLVARTMVGITLGMLHRYTQAGELRDVIRQELVYVLVAWLYSRYPSPDDPVWTRPGATVQPARQPVSAAYSEGTSVWPAFAPTRPVN